MSGQAQGTSPGSAGSGAKEARFFSPKNEKKFRHFATKRTLVWVF
nr:MAG TPA: hypothetical protein [Caudoviricetes sp.]